MSDAVGYHEAFEAARAEGRFVVPRCETCGHTFWHPRSRCPRCLSDRIGFAEPALPGRVHTFTVNRRPKKGGEDAPPVMLGYVEFDDGLRILATLDLPETGLIIGTRVRPESRDTPDGPRLVFVAEA